MAEILLLYGLAFFTLGLVIFVLPKQSGGLPFVPHLTWLAAFGLLHGMLEFLVYWKTAHPVDSVGLEWASAILLFASFVPLFVFGLRLCWGEARARNRFLNGFYVVLPLAVVVVVFAADDALTGFVAATRYLLGFPAGLLAGYGFSAQIVAVRTASSSPHSLTKYLRLASAAFIVYALSTVVLAKNDPAIPALFLTQDEFLGMFGVPVQLLRALCAVVALVAIAHLVRLINYDNRQRELDQIEKTNQAYESLQKEIEQRCKFEDELALMAVAFETQEAVVITDPHVNILRVNDAFQAITGYKSEEVIGRNPSILSSGMHDDLFYRSMWSALQSSGKWSGEVWNRRKSGEVYPEWLTIAAVNDSDGRIAHYVGSFSDITLRKQTEEQIRHLAFFDSLTRLPNRRLLHDRLTQAFNLSMRSRKLGAVMFIDLDNFKNINDSRGHEAGDQLLVEVAGRLTFNVRESDTVARLGGDEFVLVLPDLGTSPEEAAAQAEKIAEKILVAIRQPYSLADGEYHCSASLGISMFMDHEMSVDELFKSADTAMYRAKSSGKNTYFFFDREMQVALESRLKMETELRRALDQRQFYLCYQAQTDSDRRVFGAEALLRWTHPERGLISPGEFIPLAEECGLILPIGQWVLETACAQLKAWEADERCLHLQLAVNVSAYQFRQVDFVERVKEALGQSGANPALLKLELTEGMVVDDVAGCIEKMLELKQMGISFSVDDFGTGYSSLSYLKRLPIDQLKIDQSFVRDIMDDADDQAIVNTIIAMAKNMKLGVIAEGVETEEQFLFLNRNDGISFQGYLLGRPVTLAEFEGMLAV
ncbi:MAG: EAL domain-containing protein [Gallionella sp.]|nr:EAL domain-containing protein [Gallionella sp.]MCK9354773.1 EAL domain-containing protein [Gallionella sp.]